MDAVLEKMTAADFDKMMDEAIKKTTFSSIIVTGYA